MIIINYEIHILITFIIGFSVYFTMTKNTIILTSIIATTFIILATTSPAYAQVSDFYWSEDTGTGEVFTADSAGQNVLQVTSPPGQFVRIDDVEFDPLTSKVWWNNWVPGIPSASEDIYNANVDGTLQTSLGLISSCPGGPPPSGLTGIVLDPANSGLFYTRGVSYANCPLGEVSSVNMDGTAQTLLDAQSWHPDGIELSGGTVYWGAPGILTGPATGPLNQMDTAGGNKVIAQLPHVTGEGRSIAVDAANGLLFYSSHDAGGRDSGGAIFVVDLTNVAGGAVNVLNDPTTGIPDVELDATSMRIYWTDYQNGLIRSSSYDVNGNLFGPITDEVQGLTNPYGLALEIQTTIQVDIDIKPGSFPNSINTKSMGVVPVAILGSANFDVTTIDVTTLTFGPNSASPSHDLTDLDTYFDHLQDVNDDGFLDLVSHYKQKETGIACGDPDATLSGNLLPAFGAIPIEGTDSVNPKGC